MSFDNKFLLLYTGYFFFTLSQVCVISTHYIGKQIIPKINNLCYTYLRSFEAKIQADAC